MFRVLNFSNVLRFVALLTMGISILIFMVYKNYFDENVKINTLYSYSSFISLAIIFIITAKKTGRILWKCYEFIDPSVYPDLNGTWCGYVSFETLDDNGDKKNIKIKAKAIIKQTLLQTQVDIHTETSKSITIETTPTVDGGQYKLYYIYRAISKFVDRPSFVGVTFFDIRKIKVSKNSKGKYIYMLELSGRYFTDRKSVGNIVLRQKSKDIVNDVSFY